MKLGAVVGSLFGFLRRGVSFRAAALTLIVAQVITSTVAVPFKVTVDGILYISSAKSLFKNSFGADYVWYREPGYPFFLRMIHFLGSDALYISIVQAALLGAASAIALYTVWRALGRVDVSVAQLLLVLVLTLNPMFVIYSALVLQQSLFAFQLALFVLGVFWAIELPQRVPRVALVVGVFVNYALAIWTSIGWIYLALLPVILTLTISFLPPLRRLSRRVSVRRLFSGSIAIAAVALISVGTYEVGLGVYSGWQSIKAPYINHLTIPSAVIEPLSKVPRVPTAAETISRMLAIMHMGTVGPYVHENDLFLKQQMIPGRALGLWDTKYVDKPYTTYAAGWLSLSNPSNELHSAYSELAAGAPIAYSTTFVGFLLSIILSIVRRRWKVLAILVIPFAFIGVYAVSNSPIDRYGIPAYPFAVAGVAFLFACLAAAIRSHPRFASKREDARPMSSHPV